MTLQRLLVSAAALGAVAFAAPALAQPESQQPPGRADDSSTSPSTTAPPSSSQGATGAASQEQGSFTDDQLKSFLKAHDDIGRLKSMGTTPSNDQMAEAISRNGLDVTTYNAIGHALRGDQALQKRLASLRGAAPNPG